MAAKIIFAQQIDNAVSLRPFINKLHKKSKVVNILLIGDSHVQAGVLPNMLRNYFQQKYGNAGRGLIFPYQVANSNGPDDFTSSSNQTWGNFRLTYEQSVFKEMGVAGFVIGNNMDSFLEIKFANDDDMFSKVTIFNDRQMIGDFLTSYKDSKDLSDFAKRKKQIIKYTIENNTTYPEIASKFYTTTTRLTQLNGTSIQKPIAGKSVDVEENTIDYNKAFENNLVVNSIKKITSDTTQILFNNLKKNFLIRSQPAQQNLFYGFQFFNNADHGVVFNAVGVNGATYGDFSKYLLTLEQIKKLDSDFVIISLGTNESVSSITKEQFMTNGRNLIKNLRSENRTLPILLLSPTDNKLAAKKVKIVADWVQELSIRESTAFLNFYDLMGGPLYFNHALNTKEARPDNVHFNTSGYQKQAQYIWQAFLQILPKN